MSLEIDQIYHENLLYVKSKISVSDLNDLKDTVNNIIEHPNHYKEHNTHLIGNLSKDYYLGNSQKIINPYLIKLANQFYKNSDKKPCQWKIGDAWVNFQKRYEHFNLHDHHGDLSFVLWIQVPFDIENEIAISNKNINGNEKGASSRFVFVYNDIFGKLVTHKLEVDQTWEGSLIMFPSSIHHEVYPFYSSNGLRISISGNLYEKSINNSSYLYE